MVIYDGFTGGRHLTLLMLTIQMWCRRTEKNIKAQILDP
jgi:hypothetical protein